MPSAITPLPDAPAPVSAQPTAPASDVPVSSVEAAGPEITADRLGTALEPSSSLAGVAGPADVGEPSAPRAVSATSADASRVDGEAVAGQIADAVERAAAQRPRPLRIRLDPPDLGTVTIEVVDKAGRAEVRIQVETVDTHKLLRDHLEPIKDLVDKLDQRLELGGARVEVSLQNQTGGEANDREADEQGDAPGGRATRQDQPQEHEPARPRIRSSVTNLDIQI